MSHIHPKALFTLKAIVLVITAMITGISIISLIATGFTWFWLIVMSFALILIIVLILALVDDYTYADYDIYYWEKDHAKDKKPEEDVNLFNEEDIVI